MSRKRRRGRTGLGLGAAGAVLLGLGACPVAAQTSGEQPPRFTGTEVGASPTAASPMLTNAPSGFVSEPLHFGLGLVVGNLLTGASAKLWVAPTVAFQAALGAGTTGNDLGANLDLVFSASTWSSADGQYRLPVYLGVGGVVAHRFAAGRNLAFTEGGFRVPLGMAVLVRNNPIELFFQVAPELVVRSSSFPGKYGFYLDGAIGARYYF